MIVIKKELIFIFSDKGTTNNLKILSTILFLAIYFFKNNANKVSDFSAAFISATPNLFI